MSQFELFYWLIQSKIKKEKIIVLNIYIYTKKNINNNI